MQIIAIYDVAAERTSKMLKLCRQYLFWIQNSVFEGELSAAQLRKLKDEARQIMDLDYDSFIIFEIRSPQLLKKEILGREKGATDQFL